MGETKELGAEGEACTEVEVDSKLVEEELETLGTGEGGWKGGLGGLFEVDIGEVGTRGEGGC